MRLRAAAIRRDAVLAELRKIGEQFAAHPHADLFCMLMVPEGEPYPEGVKRWRGFTAILLTNPETPTYVGKILQAVKDECDAQCQ